jgi:hypothetical protein
MTTTIVEQRVASSADDVEQRAATMALTSTDLELVVDGTTTQKVGLRFTNLAIPAGATITSAYIQFQTNEVGSVATSLQIRGLASDDAAAFTTTANDLSSRPTTSSLVNWQPPSWTLVNEAGLAQRTPDLAVVLQEIVNRSGWQAGNDIAFAISGSGTRTAYSFDSNPAKAPLLHVEYTLAGGNTAPVLDLDASAAGTGYSAAFSGQGGVPIADSDAQITDPDDSAMERLEVTLTNAKPGDQLAVNGALPSGIAIDPGSTASHLILTGSASIAAYQTAVRQVLFNNTSANPDPAARTINVIVNDGTVDSSPAVATIAMGSSPIIVEKRVIAGADDVEQRNSSMTLTSSDLELVVDGPKTQQVGVRFTNIDIPAGAVITSAYIQFSAREVGSAATSLQIRGLASDDLAPFTSSANDLSGRPTTSALVGWQPLAWNLVNEAGTAQRTPDLAVVLQEIVNRSGWQAGNDVGFIITGSGTRTAYAFEGNAARAPLLHIEYTLSTSNAAPVLDLDASGSGTGYVTAFTEASPAVPVADSDVQITDSDDTQMERLTVTLTNPKAGDQLVVNSSGLPAGITIGSGSNASNIILTGTASIAAYQTAVRQVLFNNTSAAPDLTARQVAVTVNDGVASSSAAFATITIIPTNSTPGLDLDASAGGTGYTTIFSTGGGGVPIADSDVQITDPDDTEMERLTVTLTNPKSGDQLAVNSSGLPTGITVDPSSTASNVILTGSASLAAYQTAARQVLFDNTSANPDITARQVSVTVNDGAASSSPAIATIAIATSTPPAIFEKRVVASADDVEQRTTSMALTSTDLELVTDGSTVQQVGLRFTNINIPAGAIITTAYIQFQTHDVGSVATSLQIRGLASDDVGPFTTTSNDVSTRPTTGSLVNWQPPAWNLVNEAGLGQRTPDLSVVLQEVVNRSGWQPGNDIGFAITGSGTRTAYSFDSNPAKAPLLHIEYIAPNTGDIVLTQGSPVRENMAGALVGTLSLANPQPGESYVFSINDARFDIVGDQLMLKDGIRLDFERTPTLNLNVTATDTGGHAIIDMVTAQVSDVPETRFAAFGDYGNNPGTGPVAQLIQNLNVDFIITLGDNQHGSDPIDDAVGRYYSNYIGNYAGAYGTGSPINRFFPTLGNHDYSDPFAGTNASAYLSYFTLPGNERYYDFVMGPVHFFVVNSNFQEPDGITSTSRQGQWLQQGLAASTSPYNIVYFHQPPYSSGGHAQASMQWPFEQWGATAVLSGHDHIFERILRDADGDGTMLPYFVAGLGGAGIGGFTTIAAGSAARYNGNWGTMLIQASDESITFEFVAITGGGMGIVTDSYTIELPSQSAAQSQQTSLAESMALPEDLVQATGPNLGGEDQVSHGLAADFWI